MQHPLKTLIETADRAITAEDFDAVTEFYADDATLVVRPGLEVRGKPAIRRAFEAIAAHFNHSLKISQGEMVVLEGADTALVLMESILDGVDKAGAGARSSVARPMSFAGARTVGGCARSTIPMEPN